MNKVLFYGTIRGNAVEFDTKTETEWAMFTAANQKRKVWLDVGFETRQRTVPQNSALHLGMQMVADALNEGGMEMKVILAGQKDVPWSGDLVKELIYKPLMRAALSKKSTTELTKDEVSEVWDLMMRKLGEKHKVEHITFPSKETQHAVQGN